MHRRSIQGHGLPTKGDGRQNHSNEVTHAMRRRDRHARARLIGLSACVTTQVYLGKLVVR